MRPCTPFSHHTNNINTYSKVIHTFQHVIRDTQVQDKCKQCIDAAVLTHCSFVITYVIMFSSVSTIKTVLLIYCMMLDACFT